MGTRPEQSYRVVVVNSLDPHGEPAVYWPDYNPKIPGQCMHTVTADTARAAKRAARQEHKDRCYAAPGVIITT